MASVYIVVRKTRTKGKRFHVRFEEDGRAHQLGVFPTRTLAKERVRLAHQEISEGKVPSKLLLTPRSLMRTISQVAAEWQASRVDVSAGTRLSQGQCVRVIDSTFMGKIEPSRLKPEDVTRWVQDMMDAGKSAGTIRLRLIYLGAIIDYAEIVPNPVKSKKVSKPRAAKKEIVIPRLAEIEKWRAALREEYVEVFDLILATGCRIEEACTVRNKDWYPGVGVMVMGKGERRRMIPLLDGLPIFPKLVGKPDDLTWNITSGTLSDNLMKAAERAGIPSYGAHSLRHRHASIQMHEAKMSPADLAARLGHSVKILLDTYTHSRPVESSL